MDISNNPFIYYDPDIIAKASPETIHLWKLEAAKYRIKQLTTAIKRIDLPLPDAVSALAEVEMDIDIHYRTATGYYEVKRYWSKTS